MLILKETDINGFVKENIITGIKESAKRNLEALQEEEIKKHISKQNYVPDYLKYQKKIRRSSH